MSPASNRRSSSSSAMQTDIRIESVDHTAPCEPSCEPSGDISLTQTHTTNNSDVLAEVVDVATHAGNIGIGQDDSSSTPAADGDVLSEEGHERNEPEDVADEATFSEHFIVLSSYGTLLIQCIHVKDHSPTKSIISEPQHCPSPSLTDSILNDESYPYSNKGVWFAPWLDRFRAVSNDVTWRELVAIWLQFESLGIPAGVSLL